MGNDHEAMLPYLKRMLDRSGAGTISSEELKIEWYKLATDFNFAVREHLSAFSINGLDENFITSLELAHKLLTEPNLSDETWEETKRIIISERDDEQKNPNALSNALAHFHRYGKESRYLKRPSDDRLKSTSVNDAKEMIGQALSVERTVLYLSLIHI